MHSFFHPKSVAVIGASAKPGKVGNGVLVNLLYGSNDQKERKFGFQGKIYPVNPGETEMLGLTAYHSVSQVPGDIDLACILVPAKFVPQALDECGAKGIKSAIIISAGFSEVGEEGKKLEAEVVRIARSYGMRVMGPNCLGILSLHENLNASFAPRMPPKGPISFISQSGALCTAVIPYAHEEFIGFSNFVSIGNKCDIDDADLLEYFAEDPNTRCIGLYIESVKDGRKFHDMLSKVARKKPVVVLKSGRTTSGVSAAQSHTGSIAGFDHAYDAAFTQAGVQRVLTIYELFDALRVLAYQPPPAGDDIAILTNAGGPGVIAADVAYEIGLPLAELSRETIDKLNQVCPAAWSKRNPVDILGDANGDRYQKALEILEAANEVHGIILIVTPQVMTRPADIARKTVEHMKHSKKPIVASFMGLLSEESENYLEENGIPEIEFPERATVAMNALLARGRILRLWRGQ